MTYSEWLISVNSIVHSGSNRSKNHNIAFMDSWFRFLPRTKASQKGRNCITLASKFMDAHRHNVLVGTGSSYNGKKRWIIVSSIFSLAWWESFTSSSFQLLSCLNNFHCCRTLFNANYNSVLDVTGVWGLNPDWRNFRNITISLSLAYCCTLYRQHSSFIIRSLTQ
jgi:hypothetical protein